MQWNYRATDLINRNDYIYMSRFRQGTVVAVPHRENETETEYRDRCRLDPNVIGIALTNALPSEYVSVEVLPPYYMKNHETSRD